MLQPTSNHVLLTLADRTIPLSTLTAWIELTPILTSQYTECKEFLVRHSRAPSVWFRAARLRVFLVLRKDMSLRWTVISSPWQFAFWLADKNLKWSCRDSSHNYSLILTFFLLFIPTKSAVHLRVPSTVQLSWAVSRFLSETPGAKSSLSCQEMGELNWANI